MTFDLSAENLEALHLDHWLSNRESVQRSFDTRLGGCVGVEECEAADGGKEVRKDLLLDYEQRGLLPTKADRGNRKVRATKGSRQKAWWKRKADWPCRPAVAANV